MPVETFDLLLINPPYVSERRRDYLSNVMPHVSLGYLGTYLNDNGIKTRIIESNLIKGTMTDLAKKLLDLSPRIIGISATTVAIECSGKLVSEIKKINPNIPVIVGGPHISAVPEETFRRYPDFDIGVLGEGEDTLLELSRAIKHGYSYDTINGICFRRGNDIVRTEPRQQEKNIDKFGYPDFELYYPKYPEHYLVRPPFVPEKPVASILTSRGCPFQCTFCDTTVNGKLVRNHSIDFVINHMKKLRDRFGTKSFIFLDDNFMLYKPRVLALCERIQNELGTIKWACMGRVTEIDMETVQAMKRAGCYMIAYGIESGTQEILDSMKKGITLEMIKNAVQITKQAGLQIRGFFVLGFPGETKETIKKTIQFAVKLPLDFAQFTCFTPFPGSPISKEVHNYGTVVSEWNKMNLVNVAFVPKNLSEATLVTLRKEAYRRFYLHPKVIYNVFKNSLKDKKYLVYAYENVLKVIRAMLGIYSGK